MGGTRAKVAKLAQQELALNEVTLVGRLSGAPERRELPSGDVLVTFRVVVARPAAEKGRGSATVDALDCAVWAAGLQQRVLRWSDGSTVRVSGALRRRFWRGTAGAASRTEVEVQRARLERPSPATATASSPVTATATSTAACEDEPAGT